MRFRWPWVLILLAACLSLGGALYLVVFMEGLPEEETRRTDVPRYHFAFVLQDLNDESTADLRRGSLKAAQEAKAVLEFYGPRFVNLEEQASWFEAAIWEKVDGIIVQVVDEGRFTPLINQAAAQGIPVVTLGSDAATSARIAFVGASSFELGTLAAKLAVEASGAEARIALIVTDIGNGQSASRDLRVAGFIDTLQAHSQMTVEVVKFSGLGIYSAEEASRSILFDYPNTDLIVCSSPSDTIGVAQTLVDFNRVGDVKVVGFGDHPEILKYVQKGVVFGSVVPDIENVGYQAVQALAVSLQGGRVSTFINPGVRIQVAP